MLRVLVGWYFPAPCKWLVRIGIGRMYQYRGGVCFGYELLGLGYNYYKIGWAGLILTSYEFVDACVRSPLPIFYPLNAFSEFGWAGLLN